MSIATCPTCGTQYQKDEPWKKSCLKCWQKKKRAEESSSPGTNDELLKARLEVCRLTSELSALRLRLSRPEYIEPDMLTRLVRLCHPDRHGNSEASNKATAWLLEQRA